MFVTIRKPINCMQLALGLDDSMSLYLIKNYYYSFVLLFLVVILSKDSQSKSDS